MLKLAHRNLYVSVMVYAHLEEWMLRFLWALCLVFGSVFLIGGPVSADVVDKGPPYTNEDFLSLSETRIPNTFRSILPAWWARAPDYLRKRVLAAPSHMWWPIILCNFQGFRPESTGRESAETCEQSSYKGSQRGRNSWSKDGQWIGPSAECVKRDKRTQWGELICD